MPAHRRIRGLPLLLAAIAAVLMAGPRQLPQAARSVASLAFIPLRWTAQGAHRLVARIGGPETPPDELDRQLDFFRRKAQELHVQNSDLRARLEEVTAVRSIFPDRALKLLPAPVILNTDSNIWRQSLLISRGSMQGVARGQLVLWEKHLVGRIVEAGPVTSRVQLTSDPGFKIGAVTVPRFQENGTPFSARDTGVFEGAADRHGILKWASGESSAEEGAAVVTTDDPTGGIPAGLILGRVAGVSRSRGPHARLDVLPFVNSRALESVTVVLGVEP